MHPFPNKPIAAGGLLLAVCLLASPASAQTAGEGLSPTLASIKRTHVVRLGYRESSPPFSFLDHSNRPIGYSLELCEAIVEEIGVEVDEEVNSGGLPFPGGQSAGEPGFGADRERRT